MEDWLISIDEDIAAVQKTSQPAIDPEVSAVQVSPRSFPPKPPSISIRGRASELVSATEQSLFPRAPTQIPASSSNPVSSPPANKKNPQSEDPQRDPPPHLTAGLTSSRSTSPPNSYVSATNGSNVSSNPSTRVTLGAAAAGWKFDQRAKPFEREYTIDPKRGRSQHPSILRQGNPLQMRTALNGVRHPLNHGPANPARSQGFPARATAGLQGLPPRPGILTNRAPGPPMPMNHSERSVNVEIRISNVPPACSKDQLYALLGESALHRAPFSTRDRKLNFWSVIRDVQ